ncbi:hypothetical protein PVK06_036460 [Gossypium arboreum]|uniref:RNase H type-1 domain-containing protein n=1 Tax=Gossypium arboreum TaxID=29729 RepID=A0ABR0NJL1_GOSAR|nr:hypothetical protein PVK06_036460 [Gossypium arboreum]
MRPRCGSGPETILHVCRDNPVVKEVWHGLGYSWHIIPESEDTTIQWAASTGIVVRNSEGLLLGSACFWEKHMPCLLQKEALACVQAIRFAQDLGFHWVEIEGDSAVLISRLRSLATDWSMVGAYVWDAKRLVWIGYLTGKLCCSFTMDRVSRTVSDGGLALLDMRAQLGLLQGFSCLFSAFLFCFLVFFCILLLFVGLFCFVACAPAFNGEGHYVCLLVSRSFQ